MDHEPGYPSDVVERIGPVESLDGLHHRAEVAADPLRPLGGILAQVRRQADLGGIAESGGLEDHGPRAAVGYGVVPEVPALLPGPEIGERGRVGASGPVRAEGIGPGSPARGHRRELDQPGHPIRVPQSVDEELHAEARPADQGHPLGTHGDANGVEIGQVVRQRDLGGRHGV